MILTQQDITSGRTRIQSPYLYLQAAGSTGADGSAQGIHLRWDFLRSLGDTHLPKGNLADPAGPYAAFGGFNKSNDFVTVLRAPYDVTFPVILDFRSLTPVVAESGATRSWRFSVTMGSISGIPSVNVFVRFMDVAGYDGVRATIDPAGDTTGFVAAYQGVMEVEVENSLCFAVTWTMQQPQLATPGELRTETVSVEENLAASPVFLSSRKTHAINGQQNVASPSRPFVEQVAQLDTNALLANRKVFSENIRYVRFDYSDCFPVALRLETYRHFILGKITSNGWTTLRDDFALSLDNSVVFQRLEDAAYPIDHQWPRYSGANAATGLFTVNVANYIDKWNTTVPGEEGMKDLVTQYLDLSRDPGNLSASRVIRPNRLPGDEFAPDTAQDYIIDPPHPVPDEVADENGGDVVDEGATTVDSLTMIKLISTDFHAARMFGLGCIDTGVSSNEEYFVHMALYETTAPLEPGDDASSVVHVAMTLPTRKTDSRLPVNTDLKELTFGLKSLRGSTRRITNADGYLPNEPVRIINLHIEPPVLGKPVLAFYESPENFTTDNVTLPVCFGIKYKLASAPDWRIPELSNDQEYQDDSGVNETIPLAFDEPDFIPVNEGKLYVHAEQEEGLHQYAVYGINWFSRVSGLSNLRETETTFSYAEIATLLPPLNFSAQLIQSEDPPVFTTEAEQVMLQNLIAANPSGDHTLVRLTFDWNHAHHISHQWADKAQFFFRQQAPRIVRGEIKSVTEFSPEIAEVRTTGFSTYSTTVIQTFDGRVATADLLRFKGSIFSTENNQYVVHEVLDSAVPGEGSIFRLKKILEGSAQDLDNNDGFIITDDLIVPSAGERFFVTENLANAGNWTDGAPGTAQPLAKVVDLKLFSAHQEQVTEYDGTITTLNIGGIYHTATVTELEDIDDEGNPVPGSHTGVYEIAFDSFVLEDHTDPDVQWYRGTARIGLSASPGEKKVLSVIDIGVHNGTFLKIVASDPEGAAALDTIQTGPGVNVNFHPGYRVYLRAQADVLTTATTLPAAGTRVKQTLMGARSLDSTVDAVSSVSTPSVMLARETVVPLAPEAPSGAVFATRPDFYGKATYTFDTTVNTTGGRMPFAVVFYRANERSVLDALYMPSTVQSILSSLANLTSPDADYYFDRFRDLVNVTVAPDGKFKEYIPGGYRFPNPDNSKYVVPDPNPANPKVRPFLNSPNPGSITSVVKAAIEGVFFPLTEQPVYYKAIRTGRKTSNRKPVIRDSNGEFLLPTDPAYDPAPMAVILPATSTVRFTDYTLDGSARNIYFYFVKELNDLMQFSPRSPMLGPVRLINTFPPEAPGIKRITTQVEDPVAGVATGVRITLNAYLPSDNIRRFQLYRAYNHTDASSVRTMTLAATLTLDGIDFTIVDEFADLPIPPYGDTLYYRVVAMREVLNEQGVVEYVPSQPSKVALASIIDVQNPPAPTIEAEVGADSGVAFQDVTLAWSTTAYNGKYYLFKMNEAGTWNKIYETATNNEEVTYTIPGSLPKIDGQGRRIYHRFKVDVENSSGLLNLEENALVL